MASYGAGGRRDLAADLKFILKQVVHAVIVHDHHHQVHSFDPDLCAPGAAALNPYGALRSGAILSLYLSRQCGRKLACRTFVGLIPDTGKH